MKRAVRYVPLRLEQVWYGKGASSAPIHALNLPRITKKLCAGTFETTFRSSKSFSTSSDVETLVDKYTVMTVNTGLHEN